MDESIAWLQQSRADYWAAAWLLSARGHAGWCHAVAKWQQAVEKAVKAVVATLRDAGILQIKIGYRHDVERFLGVLINLPHRREYPVVQRILRNLLNESTRSGIRRLDSLAPHRPPPGKRPGRNTEYPFQKHADEWTYPAADGIFSREDLETCRSLAHRIVDGCGRIVSALRREPA